MNVVLDHSIFADNGTWTDPLLYTLELAQEHVRALTAAKSQIKGTAMLRLCAKAFYTL